MISSFDVTDNLTRLGPMGEELSFAPKKEKFGKYGLAYTNGHGQGKPWGSEGFSEGGAGPQES